MPCGVKGRISCKNIAETFQYRGCSVHIVGCLDTESCAVNDMEDEVFILKAYWDRLSRDLKVALLEHERRELEALKEGRDLIAAHDFAMSFEHQWEREQRLKICREVRGM